MSVARQLIASHLVDGELAPGREIGLRIDQTLTQDATGTLVMLELEAMGLERAQTEVSVQYVDHNLIQEDHKNPDDHLFLRSACRRFGLWYSPPGNGVSHPVHQEHFGKPGKTLLGADSHTPAAGALGMLAIGAGGMEVALANRRDSPGRRARPALPEQHPEDQRVRLRHGRPGYPGRARTVRERGGHAVVAGENYGQGSSREHAALAPRFLGLRVVIARSFARIHWQNLVNFGVLPLRLDDPSEYDRIDVNDVLVLAVLHAQVAREHGVQVENATRKRSFTAHHDLSGRQVDVVLAGGLINWAQGAAPADACEERMTGLPRRRSR